MGGSFLGVMVELLVAMLLAVTIAYCVLVNRKLVQLRSDQSELKAIVRELHSATNQAEQAIAGLRQGAQNADRSLAQQIERVRDLDEQIRTNIEKGEALVLKLSAVTRGQHTRSVESTEAVPESAASQPIRHSQVGIGLLNAQRRGEFTLPEELEPNPGKAA
ncbi:MAG: DUF6468 domain-containing protein [Hyphomicrobiaceae bacterium]|nr:DUF6468 domain-containing protein [Hyphomicrobiaceae bacterium]